MRIIGAKVSKKKEFSLEELLKQIEDEKLRDELKAKIDELQKGKDEAVTKLEEIAKSKVDYEKEITSLKSKIQKAKEDGKKELVGELETLKKSYEELRAKNETLNSELTSNKLENSLSSVLDELGVTNKPLATLALKHFAKVNENGQTIFDDGNKIVDLKSGVKEFLESNSPELLKPVGANNSATVENFNGGGLKRSSMSEEQIVDFIMEHGQEAYEKLPE